MKTKNLWVIPTDKSSRLWINTINGELVLDKEPNELHAQHIYITSDEEIKEGDWYLNTLKNTIDKCEGIISQKNVNLSDWLKKIILTTDQDLIKDGVQAIDDEFLEWFVKNPNCDEVDVVKGFDDETSYGYNFLDYKIIIPKEELKQNLPGIDGETFKVVLDREWFPKQETLVEAAEIYSFGWGENDDEKAFIEGAKWMQEQMKKLKDFDTWKEWKNKSE